MLRGRCWGQILGTSSVLAVPRSATRPCAAVDRGISSTVLAALMDHESSTITERRYVHLSDWQRTDEQVRNAMQSAKPYSLCARAVGLGRRLCPVIFSRRRSVRQLRGPPLGRDDPHREIERTPIERLRELRDGYKIVA